MTPGTLQQRPRPEDFIGLPFVLLPGCPPGHKVVGATRDGVKIRARQVEGIFNDAVLMNAIKGAGTLEKTCDAFELEVLELAETLYGVTVSDAIAIWVALPRLRGNMEWGTGGGVS